MDININKTDKLTSGLKAICGSIPGVGGIVSELISNTIPNQRIDRIARLLEILSRRVNNIEMRELQDKFFNPEFINIFEDSCIQASKAMSDDRLEYISSVLSHGILDTKLKHLKSKRYLSILSELTDQEVIVLGAYYYPKSRYPEYHARHENILRRETITLATDDDELIEDDIISESLLTHLAQLGLLNVIYEVERELKIVKIDINGSLKIARYEISKLGKNFIKFIRLNNLSGE